VNTLAIDIGGTKLAMALFESAPAGDRLLHRELRSTDRAGGRESMLRHIEDIARLWTFDRCGIGFGGPVDFFARRVALSTHVPGWTDFPLPAYLESLWNVPVIVDNDANTGALGESRYGAGRGAFPLFYITLSTGIGGGLILFDDALENGRIYRGANSYAGEIGHLTLHPDGPECLCGARGCFERHCGGLWLERDHGKSAKELLEDPDFVARYVVDLATGLKSAIMLLNPARIVVGGGISQAGDRLLVPLRAELRRQITWWSRASIEVVQAELGGDSVLWGALALAGGLESTL
jgi:glucokinase